MEDEDKGKPKHGDYLIGCPLDDLSTGEISELIELLKNEILRLEAGLSQKTRHLDAAQALFSTKDT